MASCAQAADKIRFSLDWRFEGQTSFVYDVALGDMSSLIEAEGNNPGMTAGMQMVYLVYDEAPVGYVAMKNSGIKERDLRRRFQGR